MRKQNTIPYIPDHPYRILIIGGSGTGKTNESVKYTYIPYIIKLHMNQNINS